MQVSVKPGVKPRRVNYSNDGAVMRTEMQPHLHVALDRSKTARRRRALHKGVDVWRLAHRGQEKRVRRVFLLTLTQAAQDPDQLPGHIRRFVHALKRRWPGTLHFGWLEKQNENAFNYHMQVPFIGGSWRGFTRAWVRQEWGQGFVKVDTKDGEWWRQEGKGYVRGYAKKMGNKAWQQDYEDAPRELRTFMHDFLEGGKPFWEAQLDRYEVVHMPAHARGPRWIDEHLVLRALLSRRQTFNGVATQHGFYGPSASSRASPRDDRDQVPPAGGTSRNQLVAPVRCAFGCIDG